MKVIQYRAFRSWKCSGSSLRATRKKVLISVSPSQHVKLANSGRKNGNSRSKNVTMWCARMTVGSEGTASGSYRTATHPHPTSSTIGSPSLLRASTLPAIKCIPSTKVQTSRGTRNKPRRLGGCDPQRESSCIPCPQSTQLPTKYPVVHLHVHACVYKYTSAANYCPVLDIRAAR